MISDHTVDWRSDIPTGTVHTNNQTTACFEKSINFIRRDDFGGPAFVGPLFCIQF